MFSLLKELGRFIKARRKYWLIPVLLMMLLLGILIVLAKGSPVATFLYPVF